MGGGGGASYLDLFSSATGSSINRILARDEGRQEGTQGRSRPSQGEREESGIPADDTGSARGPDPFPVPTLRMPEGIHEEGHRGPPPIRERAAGIPHRDVSYVRGANCSNVDLELLAVLSSHSSIIPRASLFLAGGRPCVCSALASRGSDSSRKPLMKAIIVIRPGRNNLSNSSKMVSTERAEVERYHHQQRTLIARVRAIHPIMKTGRSRPSPAATASATTNDLPRRSYTPAGRTRSCRRSSANSNARGTGPPMPFWVLANRCASTPRSTRT